jgi:hypothetical protein
MGELLIAEQYYIPSIRAQGEFPRICKSCTVPQPLLPGSREWLRLCQDTYLDREQITTDLTWGCFWLPTIQIRPLHVLTHNGGNGLTCGSK